MTVTSEFGIVFIDKTDHSTCTCISKTSSLQMSKIILTLIKSNYNSLQIMTTSFQISIQSKKANRPLTTETLQTCPTFHSLTIVSSTCRESILVYIYLCIYVIDKCMFRLICHLKKVLHIVNKAIRVFIVRNLTYLYLCASIYMHLCIPLPSCVDCFQYRSAC